jgi:uncharacterized membrane protein YbhN (UPF0104 family)
MIKKIISRLKGFYNSRWGLALKIIVSISILVIFFRGIDFNSLKQLVNEISPFEIIVLLLLTVIRNYVGAVRFFYLIINKIKVSVPVLMSHYFQASFFNNFLPTAIGGDVLRVFLLSDYGYSKGESTLYIFIERLIGFYALIFISFTSSLFWEVSPEIFYSIAALFLVYSSVLFVFFIFGKKIKSRLNIVNKIIEVIKLVSAGYQTFLLVFIISLLFQFVSIYISYYVAISILGKLNILHFLTFVPLVWFVTMIPVSFGGVGLRELSFFYFLGTIGINREDSLIISLGTYFTLLLSGVIGLIIYYQSKASKLYAKKRL